MQYCCDFNQEMLTYHQYTFLNMYGNYALFNSLLSIYIHIMNVYIYIMKIIYIFIFYLHIKI